MDHGGEVARHRGHHRHRPRSRDYEWPEDEARSFLEQAATDARRRYPPIARLVAPLLAEGRVLVDLGCGPAMLLPEIAEATPAARLLGVDPSRPMLRLATRVLSDAPPGSYGLLEGRAEAIPLRDGTVDVVVALKNLHEWEDARQGLAEVARVLRPGGVLVLSDSNRAFPEWRLRLLVAWVRLTQGAEATGRYVGPYRDAYRPHEVEEMLANVSLEVVQARKRGVEFLYLARRRRG